MTDETNSTDSPPAADTPQTSESQSSESADLGTESLDTDQGVTSETEAAGDEPTASELAQGRAALGEGHLFDEVNSTLPLGEAASDTAPAPVPQRKIELPVIGQPVAVYGIEHDGRHVAATTADVNEAEGTINVSGARRNGQYFSHTHVKFLEDPPKAGEQPEGVSAADLDDHIRAEHHRARQARPQQPLSQEEAAGSDQGGA